MGATANESEKQHHINILGKVCVVWDANPEYSLFALLAKLCGDGTTSYILQTFKDGRTEDIESKTFSHIIEVGDEELEERLDDLVD